MDNQPDLGLVLSGGASRGAYQAGVLRFIFRQLPKRLGYVPWPSVVSGTSVGALNGMFVVTRSERYLVYLSRIWRRMRVSDVFRIRPDDVIGAFWGRYRGRSGAALLDPSPLEGLIRELFPQEETRSAIDTGKVRAFITCATDLADGTNTLFLDTADDKLDLRPLPGTRVIRLPVSPRVLLASSAIPFLFPPVRLAGRTFVDGGLRQNTPLRPVLQTGVDRILMIGTHAEQVNQVRHAPDDTHDVVPTLAFLAGKSLNAIMADPVDRDLVHAERTNRFIDWGVQQYGPGFAAQVKQDMGVRKVRILTIRPRLDLGAVANATFRAHPPKDGPTTRLLLNLMADSPNDAGGESDLLSYVYFDREFTGRIEAQGYEDARKMEAELVDFFTQPVG
jgi:NTE family protein